MAVQPKKGKLVPSHVICGWERGMIYDVGKDGDVGTPLTIQGVHNGREFNTIEYTDNVEERPKNE